MNPSSPFSYALHDSSDMAKVRRPVPQVIYKKNRIPTKSKPNAKIHLNQ
jgi:hypothetical protein